METDTPILPPDSIVIAENVGPLRNTFSEHGNEIDEIISKRPPFIVRWGTLFLLVLLLCIGAVSWIIRYPDIINANAKLTCINAPKPVITLVNGKLIKLNIAENQSVMASQILGYIESNANHNEVLNLSRSIDSIQKAIGK